MTARDYTEGEKKIINDIFGPKAKPAPTNKEDQTIVELAKLRAKSPLEYDKRRKETADELGVRVSALDEAVHKQGARSHDEASALPHWKAEPWADAVSGAELLASIKSVFEKYIVLPAGAADVLSLWVLHAWTIDAGDISPFLVLASPTKRCGKTSVLIVLCYLTPRSELASNISASALFRYVEEMRPTLLIDEADSFLKADEAMRGILNSGHTRAAAYVIRSVETNGDHKPKRFSTWTPKAIAAIGELADTLRDRAVILQLQRKSRMAKVARLRKRDSDEFALLRRKAARWAADNFDRLRDPDPQIPDALDDRAADNWRPLLAIADLAGDDWPRRAREAACLLSGAGHDTPSIGVELLADIRRAFGDALALRSVDLVAKLNADPERPWVEWRRGKPLTPKQLGSLLAPFGITSETVSIPDLADAKGYKRVRFESLWDVYVPGQNTLPDRFSPSETSKRRNADGTGVSGDFQSVAENAGDGSKNDELSYSHAGSDASTFQKPATGREGDFDQADAEPADDAESVTDTGWDDAEPDDAEFGLVPKDTRAQVEPRAKGSAPIGAHKLKHRARDDLEIPPILDRRPQPRQDGPWAGTYLSDDDIEFIESGKFK
jgi:putative DNA primase/helicase